MDDSSFNWRRFDIFPKSKEDVQTSTTISRAISLLALLLLIFLFLKEVRSYREAHIVTKFFIDSTTNEFLTVEFNISFPTLHCNVLTLDALDALGGSQFNVKGDRVFKITIEKDNPAWVEMVGHDTGSKITPEEVEKAWSRHDGSTKYCGSCYGAIADESVCCNTCDAVKEAWEKRGWNINKPDAFEQCYREKLTGENANSGCRIEGSIRVPKVKGVLIFSPGDATKSVYAFQQRMSISNGQGDSKAYPIKLDHEIHHFSFGKGRGSASNPLDGHRGNEEKSGVYKYLVEVVKTIRHRKWWNDKIEYQYSLSEHFSEIKREDRTMMHIDSYPSLQIRYDVNPLLVSIRKERMPFSKFLTHICGVLGGVYTSLQLSLRVVGLLLRMWK